MSAVDQEPKDAASVLLLRKSGPEGKHLENAVQGFGEHRPGAPDLEVYMIRREESLRFLGGYYAFPGGHVDPDDYEMARNMPAVDPGSRSAAARPDGEPFGEKAAAHQVAAIRELYEECGVLLARPAAGVRPDRSGQGAFPAALRDRARLLAGQIRFCQILDRAGLRPDLEALSFLDRWVTPEGLPIRYDTKFYTAWMPEDQQPDPYAGEASWGGWVRPQTALHDADSGRIPMVFSTMACLWKLMEL